MRKFRASVSLDRLKQPKFLIARNYLNEPKKSKILSNDNSQKKISVMENLFEINVFYSASPNSLDKNLISSFEA